MDNSRPIAPAQDPLLEIKEPAGPVASTINSSHRGSLLTRKATFSKSDMSEAVEESTASVKQESATDVDASVWLAEDVTKDDTKEIEVAESVKEMIISATQATQAPGQSVAAATGDPSVSEENSAPAPTTSKDRKKQKYRQKRKESRKAAKALAKNPSTSVKESVSTAKVGIFQM